MRFGFGIRRRQCSIGPTEDGTWRTAFRESDDLAPLVFGQAWFASGSWTITQPVDSFGIEANDSFADRLGMAAQFLRNRAGPQPVPTPDNHLGAENPVTGRVSTLGKPTDPAFFSVVVGIPSMQEFRHRRLPRH